jgi:hypothetical protein
MGALKGSGAYIAWTAGPGQSTGSKIRPNVRLQLRYTRPANAYRRRAVQHGRTAVRFQQPGSSHISPPPPRWQTSYSYDAGRSATDRFRTWYTKPPGVTLAPLGMLETHHRSPAPSSLAASPFQTWINRKRLQTDRSIWRRFAFYSSIASTSATNLAASSPGTRRPLGTRRH